MEPEALGERDAGVLDIATDDGLNARLGIQRRFLGASGEEDIVLDFEAAERIFQQHQLFINGHGIT